jgi:hypothetical protein
MDQDTGSFVHPAHLAAFIEAAHAFNCHILVRETGVASISWIGREGYTGKRADVKAKTAKKSVGAWQLAGLVCSPEIHPGAFPDIGDAMRYWKETLQVVTVPKDATGFDDRARLQVKTPYVLQTNPRHRHYGCIAWVEMGLVTPRYVHGDYDLYAIVPAGQAYDPMTASLTARKGLAGSAMNVHAPLATLGARPAPDGGHKLQGIGNAQVQAPLGVDDLTGPLSFRVATFINNRIAAHSAGYAGALMVNHGEQVNLGRKRITNERVLAFLAQPRNGQVMKILEDSHAHAEFFRSA